MVDSAIDSDLWHVELPSGEIHVITLDQLDDAFNRGLVNEHTRVWQEGMGAAMPLGELLGSEAEAESPPPAVAAVTAAPVGSISTWPPVVSASVAPPPSTAPPSSATSWQTVAIPSVRPLAFDVGDDLEAFAKPRRSRAVLLALAAMLGIGAGVLAYGRPPSGTDVAAATVAPLPRPEPEKSHAYDPGDAPVHLREVPPVAPITPGDAPPTEAPKASAKEAPTLREAMIAAANSKIKARANARAGRRAPARGRARSSSYKGTMGGSKYDPLNGAL
jgi:hypothetical protein